jgi:hypothetical protein
LTVVNELSIRFVLRRWRQCKVRLWLFSPHRQLGGDRPADRIQQGVPTTSSR